MHAIVASFERNYERRFGAGAGYREAGIVLTGLRLRVHGRVRKPTIAPVETAGTAPFAEAARGERDVYWHELKGRAPTRIWDGTLLRPGNELEGPAVVELPDTTVVVRPERRLAIDPYGNAIVGV
jgi:N-methylhydantoinase A